MAAVSVCYLPVCHQNSLHYSLHCRSLCLSLTLSISCIGRTSLAADRNSFTEQPLRADVSLELHHALIVL